MPDAETFDAFYARTVWSVTSQLHALADGDGAADHAVREAYARAYQQWYEISSFPDTEAWVLGAARDAYQRRRPDYVLGSRAPARHLADSSRDGTGYDGRDRPPSDSTWPGIYRPRTPAVAPPAADPEATVAPPATGNGRPGRFFFGDRTPRNQRGTDPASAGRATAGQGHAAAAGTAGTSAWDSAPPSSASSGDASRGNAFSRNAAHYTAALHTAALDTSAASAADAAGYPEPGTQPFGPSSPGAPARAELPSSGHARTGLLTGPGAAGNIAARTRRPAWTADRRKVIAAAAVAAIAVLVAVVAYLASGGHQAAPAAGTVSKPKTRTQPAVQMLPAGHTGSRASIPWSLIGSGWTVAETSTAAPNQNGQAAGSGSYTTFLVDPEGGKYQIATMTASTPPDLLAWSGDGHSALYAGSAGAGQPASYSVLSLTSGQLSALPLPAGVSAMGFTRPDGLNILAVRLDGSKYKLQRYNLQGKFQATLASMTVRAGQGSWSACGAGCGALSSPDGDTAVWGIAGDEMQLVSNRGGLIRKLHVPDSGEPPSCAPVSWWSQTEVLADCAAAGGTGDVTELWLVPADGASPAPLTAASGSLSGSGVINGAWQTSNSVYATVTSAQQCPTAATGPGGQSLVSVANESASAVTVPRSTGYHASIVETAGKRLLLLAQTTCPGTSSLIWYDPASHSARTVLTAPSTQVGVIAAVPYGNGPTAISQGAS